LLPTLYVALTDTAEEYISKVEGRAFIDKHHLDFSEVQYGHFKLTIGNLDEVLTSYEAQESEAPTAAKVRTHFTSLNEKLAGYEFFQDAENYPQNLNNQLLMAALQNDTERVHALIS
jgi:hypothetical protein